MSTNGIFLRTSQDIKRDLRLSSPVKLSHLRVCNGILLAAIGPSTILKLSVSNAEKPVEINLPNAPAGPSLAHLHLSPTGLHAIVSFLGGENYYIHTKTGNCFALKKRSVIMTVGWNGEIQKDDETGPILVGTSRGGIYETSINSAGTITYFKEIKNSLVEKDTPISDIQLRMISDEDEKNSRWICFVSQTAKLFSVVGFVDLPAMQTITKSATQFIGTSTLQSGWMVGMGPSGDAPEPVFAQLFNPKSLGSTSVLSAQSATPSKKAFLALYPPTDEPKRFVWLSGSSYTIGRVDLSVENAKEAMIEEKTIQNFRLPRVEGNLEEAVGVALSEWHALIAFPSRITAVSLYSYATAYEDRIPIEMGSIRGLTKDASSEYNWAFTETHSFKYRSNDEARYVWRVLLDKGDYAKAVVVARNRQTIDPSAFEWVLRRQADKYIQDKNYIAAAEILAHSSEPFETVVLRFLSTEEDRRTGLKTFLEKKLQQYQGAEDRIKREALTIWLLEVQLEELAESRRSGGDTEGDRTRQLTKQLQGFLTRKSVLEFVSTNRESVYKLIVSHADFDTQLYIANELKVLKKQSAPDFFYKYAPILAKHIPRHVFQALLTVPKLRPNRFLSLFTQCQNDREMAQAALPYLEAAVRTPTGKGDVALQNMLIAMYSTHRPKMLKGHLESLGIDRNSIPYNIDYALRTCQQSGHDECVIFLYCVNEMFLEAVDIALKIDINLAKSCARWMEPGDDFLCEKFYPEELRRRVWLKIASHVIQMGGEAAEAIGLLKESQDVIKIQDILPFFPQFVKIEHFKEPLCECLREHSTKIQELQRNMKEATQIATDIRDRCVKLDKRTTVIRAGEVCTSCFRSLLSRPFFAHSCRHFFHRDCLETIVRPFLSKGRIALLDELVKLELRLIDLLNAEEQVGTGSVAHVLDKERKLTEVNAQIGELLGDDCPLCGDRAIESIDTPFFTDDEYIRDANTWKL
ncbi:unnamed protein product, partial [Mesorhabditis belari]|uniref:Vacuolar protein sorting-associated protein 18 homolog n=1 Tax=Mesorhabditis belari TaxID=2138241 RepID=A0AAF3FGQ7_9BILA